MKHLMVNLIFVCILFQQCTVAQQEETIYVPMRDGVRLETEIWKPIDDEGPWPVILIRVPYDKTRVRGYGKYFSDHGYAVALQDVRGQYGSEGSFELFIHEKQDGYDAVEWIAKQDWCNGRVGMTGGSYSGYTQLAAAVAKPPHLVTIIPKVTMGDPSSDHIYPGGVFTLIEQMQAAHMFAHDFATLDKHPPLPRDWKDKLETLPVEDLDMKLTGKKISQWRTFIDHKPGDPYWDQADFLDEVGSLKIPAYIIGGWYDFGGIGTKQCYLHLKKSQNQNIKLLLGPWTHHSLGKSKLGPFDFGPEAKVNIDHECLRWFDHWLKGEDNGIMEEPLVKVFATGPNHWAHGSTYPLPESRSIKYYLGPTGISPQPSSHNLSYTSYVYDPGNPTPSVWYDNADQHETLLQGREDILILDGEVLEEDIMLLGPVGATLYASSNSPETDWFVYLMEVDSAGHPGQLLLRGQTREALDGENTVKKLVLDLWHTSYLVPAGSKLRVMVCSAAFPSFSRNLNTGRDNETTTAYKSAVQKIYHSPEYPSHIELHVIDINH